MKTIGIDGCPSGWFGISIKNEEDVAYKIIEDKEALLEIFESYDRILIDIPIGVESEKYVRRTDEELRKKLGSDYYASVFNPPIRPALYAPTYAEACMQSYEINEKKISLQSWNITPKIRMVDELLQEHEQLRERVLESHPELLFRIMNGNNSLLQKKNTKEGLRHRRHLIKEYNEELDEVYREVKEEYRRNEVRKDDIIDTLALAIFAYESRDQPIKTIPDSPDTDETGLPMAIHYVKKVMPE